MQIHIHIHTHHDPEIKTQLQSINNKLNIMGEKTDQALADLQVINDKLQKIGNESAATLQKVSELEAAAAANADTPQSVLDAIAAVKAQAQIVDDLVPDAQPPIIDTPENP